MAAAVIAAAVPARADHPATPATAGAHAAEHEALERIVARERHRWSRLAPTERRRADRRYRAEAEAIAAATEGPPEEVGVWSQGPFNIPNYAVHAVLLPTGKVLFWGYPPPSPTGPRPNAGVAALWDPKKGYGATSLKNVPPPVVDPDGSGPQPPVPAPIYCSGQSLLPNGDVLVAGGNYIWAQNDPNDPYTIDAGLNTLFTFDPFAERWVRQPNMADGRWYPSQVLLGDGRTVILSGFTDDPPGAVLTDDLEVFTPAAANGGVGTLQLRTEAARRAELYPHLFTLPSGDVLLGGPGAPPSGVDDSAVLDVPSTGGSFAWQDQPPPAVDRYGGTAVLLPAGPGGSWWMRQIGGYPPTGPPDGSHLATASTEDFLWEQGWQPDAPLNAGRSYHNTVLLPDGSMVTVGGGLGWTPADRNYATDPQGMRRRVEIYDPKDPGWRLGPAQIEDRAYHSTAVLLPDGRVWSAGDDLHGPNPIGGYSMGDTAEIYNPPYLYRGRRPWIQSAPAKLKWGDDFGVRTYSGRASAQRAVLVAPGATTHAADMHQRVVRLKKLSSPSSPGINLLAPPKPEVAPPGYYMLFLLSDKGVPSIASWVRLDPNAPNAPLVP